MIRLAIFVLTNIAKRIIYILPSANIVRLMRKAYKRSSRWEYSSRGGRTVEDDGVDDETYFTCPLQKKFARDSPLPGKNVARVRPPWMSLPTCCDLDWM